LMVLSDALGRVRRNNTKKVSARNDPKMSAVKIMVIWGANTAIQPIL